MRRAEGNEIRRKRAMQRPDSLEKVLKFSVTGYWKLVQKRPHRMKKIILCVCERRYQMKENWQGDC